MQSWPQPLRTGRARLAPTLYNHLVHQHAPGPPHTRPTAPYHHHHPPVTTAQALCVHSNDLGGLPDNLTVYDGLIARRNRRRVRQYRNICVKRPAGCWAQPWVNERHALAHLWWRQVRVKVVVRMEGWMQWTMAAGGMNPGAKIRQQSWCVWGGCLYVGVGRAYCCSTAPHLVADSMHRLWCWAECNQVDYAEPHAESVTCVRFNLFRASAAVWPATTCPTGRRCGVAVAERCRQQ